MSYIIYIDPKTQLDLSYNPIPGHMCGSACSVRVRHPVLCGTGKPHHLTRLHQLGLPGDLWTKQG